MPPLATMRAALCVVAVALLATAAADYDEANYDGLYESLDMSQYADEYDDLYKSYDDFGYGGDAADPEYGGYGDDNLHYYGDEYGEYYEQYGTYGDQYGDDYFFDYEERVKPDCKEGADGNYTITGSVCHLVISGANKVADKLPGGIDGVYAVQGCWNGRPRYLRKNSKPDQERTLWFSQTFSDWDISAGATVDEAAILMYGGDGMEETRPNFIDASKWHVASKWASSNASEEYGYIKVNLNVSCAEAARTLKQPDATIFQPLITNDEMEAKYRAIYTRYSAKQHQDPTVSFTMIVFVVLIGMAVVLAVPYIMLQKKGGKGFARSLAQGLEDARKRRAGRTQ